jgi:hypothetical protein
MNMPVDAFLTALYTHVDDWYQAHGPRLLAGKAGDHPTMADSEVLTLMMAQHWLGHASEREFLRYIRQNYLALFPRLLNQSEFNRRSRSLSRVLNEYRRWLVREVGAHSAPAYLLDGTPVHVRHWRRYGPRSLSFPGANLGYCAAKRETFYGYKLVLLVTIDGRVLDFVLLPAGADERTALDELLTQYRNLEIYADKGFVDERRRKLLQERYGHRLFTPKRRNQKEQNPKVWDALCTSLRQIVETTIGQAKEWLGLEKPRAKTFWGLTTRLIAKLTALALAAWENSHQRVSPLRLAEFRFAS